jgi:hypothetical protein
MKTVSFNQNTQHYLDSLPNHMRPAIQEHYEHLVHSGRSDLGSFTETERPNPLYTSTALPSFPDLPGQYKNSAATSELQPQIDLSLSVKSLVVTSAVPGLKTLFPTLADVSPGNFHVELLRLILSVPKEVQLEILYLLTNVPRAINDLLERSELSRFQSGSDLPTEVKTESVPLTDQLEPSQPQEGTTMRSESQRDDELAIASNPPGLSKRGKKLFDKSKNGK